MTARAGVPAVAVVLVAGLLASCADAAAPETSRYRSDIRSNTLAASVASMYPRTVLRTAFGDPVTLDTCSLAAGSTVSGVRLVAPDVTDPAGCTLTSESADTVTVSLRPTGPGGGRLSGSLPQTTLAAGASAYDFPYNDTTKSCARAVSIYRRGLATSWVLVVARPGTAGRERTACSIAGQLGLRYYTRLTGDRAELASLPRLGTATRSVLGLDACKVAGAGQVARAIGATGPATSTDFGAGCVLRLDAGSVQLLPGALRAGATLPGSPRVVDGRRVSLVASDAPRCSVVAQVGREVVAARFTGTGDTAPADCGVAATALVAYLDALDGD